MTYNILHCHILERNFALASKDIKKRPNLATERHCTGVYPLHMAIVVGAPDELILDLIRAYPYASVMPGPRSINEIVTKYGASEQVKKALKITSAKAAAKIGIRTNDSSHVSMVRSSSLSELLSIIDPLCKSKRKDVRFSY